MNKVIFRTKQRFDHIRFSKEYLYWSDTYGWSFERKSASEVDLSASESYLLPTHEYEIIEA